MTDTIEVWRDTDSSLDDGTLVESTVAGTRIYNGKARVRPTRGPREQPVSEGVMSMRDADFLVPIDATIPMINDEVYVALSTDPGLQGTWFRVTDVRVFSQQAARGFSGVQAQPSKRWRLGVA